MWVMRRGREGVLLLVKTAERTAHARRRRKPAVRPLIDFHWHIGALVPGALEVTLGRVANAPSRGIREAVEALTSEQRSAAALLAGGSTYRFFPWLVPFGFVVAAIASFWVRSSPTSLENAAKSFGLGGVAARWAISAVEDGSRERWYLLVTGMLLIV